MKTPDAARIPERDERQACIDHATWIAQRKRHYRCICVTCWNAHQAGSPA